MLRYVSYFIVLAFTSIALSAATGFLAYAAEEGVEVRKVPSAGERKMVVGFEDEKGNTLFLRDFKGKAVLITLWASWCQPCVKEMPLLAALQEQYQAKGLVVLALSQDENMKKITDFYKERPELSALTPLWDKNHMVYRAFSSKGIPMSVLVDRQGKPFKRIEGPVNWQADAAKKMIEELLAQK